MFIRKFAAGIFSVALWAQTPQTASAPPRFASASIVRDASGHNGIWNKFDPVVMIWTGAPLRVLVQAAFSLRSYQIANWPKSVDSEQWNIDARSEGPSTGREKYAMLQTLLVERFGLQFHREMRDVSGYILTVAKNGPKMEEVKDVDLKSSRVGVTNGRGRILGKGVAMYDWLDFLSGALGCPIEDRTGLTGRYNFLLEWSPDETQSNSESEPSDPNGPSIFAAIQGQLGLRLQAKKVPMQMLVIDHLNRLATAN